MLFDAINTLRYCIAVMLVVAIPAAIIYWLLIHPFAGFWRSIGKRKAFTILCSVLIVTMLAMFQLRSKVLVADLGTNWLLMSMGLALLAVSGVLLMRLSSELPVPVLIGIPELSTDRGGWQVITTGLYARVRHPRYLQMDLALLGYALVANYPAGYAAVLFWLVGIRIVVVFEERELLERYGEAYRDYCSRVPRFLPARRSK